MHTKPILLNSLCEKTSERKNHPYYSRRKILIIQFQVNEKENEGTTVAKYMAIGSALFRPLSFILVWSLKNGLQLWSLKTSKCYNIYFGCLTFFLTSVLTCRVFIINIFINEENSDFFLFMSNGNSKLHQVQFLAVPP